MDADWLAHQFRFENAGGVELEKTRSGLPLPPHGRYRARRL
jgi:hypothetical protein